jgi:hypothetical protein
MKETIEKRIKTGGREIGTPNKVTKELRLFFKELLDQNQQQIENDLKELKPKDRIELLIKMAEFVVPKLNKNSVNLENRIDGIDIIIE